MSTSDFSPGHRAPLESLQIRRNHNWLKSLSFFFSPALRQDLSADDGGKRARSPGGARRKPLKPLRAGMPGDSGVLVVTRVRFTNTKCTRDRGCNGHPAFPTPSLGGRFINGSGALRSEGVNARLESRYRHSSCPGLTRASINLHKTIFEEDGLPGRARQ
jgi:hypothetical protein